MRVFRLENNTVIMDKAKLQTAHYEDLEIDYLTFNVLLQKRHHPNDIKIFKKAKQFIIKEIERRAELIPTNKLMNDLNYYYET